MKMMMTLMKLRLSFHATELYQHFGIHQPGGYLTQTVNSLTLIRGHV